VRAATRAKVTGPAAERLFVSFRPCHTCVMHEPATLKLDTGAEVRVEVDRDDLTRDEIVVRRSGERSSPTRVGLLHIVDAHLAVAAPHAPGTTDRHLAADRQRPY